MPETGKKCCFLAKVGQVHDFPPTKQFDSSGCVSVRPNPSRKCMFCVFKRETSNIHEQTEKVFIVSHFLCQGPLG